MMAGGKVPAAGLLVAVREVFFHCAKAVIRSKLWDPSRYVERGSLPSLGRILADQTQAVTVEEAERSTEEGYRIRLY